MSEKTDPIQQRGSGTHQSSERSINPSNRDLVIGLVLFVGIPILVYFVLWIDPRRPLPWMQNAWIATLVGGIGIIWFFSGKFLQLELMTRGPVAQALGFILGILYLKLRTPTNREATTKETAPEKTIQQGGLDPSQSLATPNSSKRKIGIELTLVFGIPLVSCIFFSIYSDVFGQWRNFVVGCIFIIWLAAFDSLVGKLQTWSSLPID